MQIPNASPSTYACSRLIFTGAGEAERDRSSALEIKVPRQTTHSRPTQRRMFP